MHDELLVKVQGQEESVLINSFLSKDPEAYLATAVAKDSAKALELLSEDLKDVEKELE